MKLSQKTKDRLEAFFQMFPNIKSASLNAFKVIHHFFTESGETAAILSRIPVRVPLFVTQIVFVFSAAILELRDNYVWEEYKNSMEDGTDKDKAQPWKTRYPSTYRSLKKNGVLLGLFTIGLMIPASVGPIIPLVFGLVVIGFDIYYQRNKIQREQHDIKALAIKEPTDSKEDLIKAYFEVCMIASLKKPKEIEKQKHAILADLKALNDSNNHVAVDSLARLSDDKWQNRINSAIESAKQYHDFKQKISPVIWGLSVLSIAFMIASLSLFAIYNPLTMIGLVLLIVSSLVSLYQIYQARNIAHQADKIVDKGPDELKEIPLEKSTKEKTKEAFAKLSKKTRSVSRNTQAMFNRVDRNFKQLSNESQRVANRLSEEAGRQYSLFKGSIAFKSSENQVVEIEMTALPRKS